MFNAYIVFLFFKDIDNNICKWAWLERWKHNITNRCFKMELTIKGLLFFFLFIFKGSSYFFYRCFVINAKVLLIMWFWRGGWGEENECAVLRTALWSLPLAENSQLNWRNRKRFMIVFLLNGLWSCLNWQSVSLPLHPVAHQPVIS